MNPRTSLLLAGVLAASLLPATLSAASTLQSPARAPAAPNADELFERCATHAPDRAEVEQANRRLNELRASSPLGAGFHGGAIRVAIHVITNGAVGAVSDQAIADQMRELNRNFAGTGYRFDLVSVDRTDKTNWFKMSPGSGAEDKAKQALAIDPTTTMNVYICDAWHYLGWSYFPWSLPQDHHLHGIVIDYGSLPGGYQVPYDLGRTLSHEAGHYLGLYHTFQGGCVAPGDAVDDTPFEAAPAYGCPIGLNTCPDPGDDPIHNYMDYTDDLCYEEFTAGQMARMDEIASVYRSGLFTRSTTRLEPADARPAAGGGSFELLGTTPHPVRADAMVRFRLAAPARVSLGLYSVAGQRVRTLVEAEFPAGDHSAPLSSEGLPAGVYFAVLRVNGASESRAVILTH